MRLDPGSSNDKHILVVDDEQDIVDIVRFSLRVYGYRVCTFTDPVVALEHFKSNHKNHDLIISDLTRPGMNGYEFVKQASPVAIWTLLCCILLRIP